MRAARTLALTAVVAAVGCAPGKSTLDVTVDSATMLSAVDHLRVALTDAAGKKAMDINVPVAGGSIPPAVAFALRFPSTVKGKVTLSVDAMPASGGALAGAAQDVDIQPSKRASVAVQLSPGGHATRLAFAVQPSDSAVAASIKPPVQVAVQDSSGMPVAVDGVAVTLALGDNPSGATLGGTLTAMTAGGVATFGDVKLDKTGDGYTLVASAEALAAATSTAFKVTPPAWVSVNSGLFGGNVQSLVVDPKHTATLYAATNDAGVWKTIDAGAHWTNSSSGLPTGSPVSSIAIDPVTTTTLYAMVALGASPASDGIYKTADGGASWTRLAASPATAGAPYGIVAVDPSNPQTVYAVAGRVINRSSNGGTSFSVLTATITYGPGVRGLSIDYLGNVWLACYGDSIQYMAVGGTGFAVVAGTAANPLPSGHSSCCYYTAVGVEPSDRNYVYASRDSGVAGQLTYRTINAGAGAGDWSALNAPVMQAFAFGQPSGGTTVRYATSGQSIYSSSDGTTWSQVGNNMLPDAAQAIAIVADNSGSFAASRSGVFKLSGFTWALATTGMTANPVAALTIDPKNSNIVFAGLVNAGQVRTTDAGGTWSPPAAAGAIPGTAGVVNDIAVDETDDKLVWAAATFPYRSTDGGTTWAQVAGGAGSGKAIAAAPSLSGRFYLGGLGNAYVINAGSSTWMPAGAGLPATNDSVALVVHPTSPMTVYDATAGGGIYATTDAGATWMARNSGLGSLKTTALAIDRTTPTTLLAGTSDQGLFKSTDGSTWATTGSGLTSMAITAVVIARSNPMVVYVGTRGAGVFRSGDGGATFVANSAGLPSLYVTRLAVDPTNPQLVYAGTIDGGVAKTVP